MEIDIWPRNPLVEPGDRDSVCSADVTQGGRTASTHDTGRGLVVLVDLQDYRAVEDAVHSGRAGKPAVLIAWSALTISDSTVE